MDRTEYDQLTALADRRAAAAETAAAELGRVADDFIAVAAGYVGFRHAADALTEMAETDRQLAAFFRRLALSARAITEPEPEPPAVAVSGDLGDWRAWTEDTFAEPEPESQSQPDRRGDDSADDDDWAGPLTADVRPPGFGNNTRTTE